MQYLKNREKMNEDRIVIDLSAGVPLGSIKGPLRWSFEA